MRLKNLLREFAAYQHGRGSVAHIPHRGDPAGFSDAWKRRDYAVIVQVADRLPSQVIEEDANLLMYVDNARLRFGQLPQQATIFE